MSIAYKKFLNKDIIDTSSSVSTTLENIKNVSFSVAESSKFIANKFIEKTTRIKNISSFTSLANIVLDSHCILRKIFKFLINKFKRAVL